MIDLGGAASFLPLTGAGFGVGFLVGLTGVGGGALMTPLLISSFGVSPQIAVGTDLLYASITDTVGGWRHHVARHVEWPIVLRLAVGSIPAAIGLLAVMAYLPVDTVALARWIRSGLVVALPISGLAIVLYPWFTRTSRREEDGNVTSPDACDGPLWRHPGAARHPDFGRGGCNRGHRACSALSDAAGETARRLRHRACGAADPDRRARPSRPR